MGKDDRDVFDIVRELGITIEQLEKRYAGIDGSIDWDRVEKNKSNLHLFFPSPMTLIERLDEALEESKDQLDEHIEEEKYFREEMTSDVQRLRNGLRIVNDKCTGVAMVSIFLSVVAILIAIVF